MKWGEDSSSHFIVVVSGELLKVRYLAQILAHCEQAISIIIIVTVDKNGNSIFTNCGKNYVRICMNVISLVQSQVCGCDMIYSKKCTFSLHPLSWHRSPKILGISQVMRTLKLSFVMLMR